MKSFKWLEGKLSNGDTKKQSHDHPMTVEFPSPVEHPSPSIQYDAHESRMIKSRHLSPIQSSDDEEEKLAQPMHNAITHVDGNDESQRRISEGDSTQTTFINNTSESKDMEQGDFADQYGPNSTVTHRLGGRPTIITSNSLYNVDNSQSNRSGAGKRKVVTTFSRRPASTGSINYVAMSQTRNVGGGVNNIVNNNSEREEAVEDGFDVKAAFEKEHKAVRKFKVVVIVLLVAAAIAVSLVVYFWTSQGEVRNFKLEFDDYALKVITNFHHLAIMRQWAAYSVAAQFTANCQDNFGSEEKAWPNVTMPDFHDQVRGLLVLAHSMNIEFSPFFPNDNTIRSEWEAYATENEAVARFVPEWVKRDSEIHKDHGTTIMQSLHENTDNGHGMTPALDPEFDMGPAMNAAVKQANGLRSLRGLEDGNIFGASEIDHFSGMAGKYEGAADHFELDDDSYSDGRCAGISKITKDNLPSSWGETLSNHVHPSRPINQGIYTMDGVNVVDETHDAIKMPFLAPSWQIHPPSGNEGRVMYNEYSDCHRRRAIHTMLKTGGPAMSEVLYGFEDHHHFFDEPASILTYPVHSNFDEKNKTMVGFITITFNWLDVFWNILPETISGIIAVIETSSEQTTSFRIDGKQGIFMGEGDFHNEKWDGENMKRSSSVYRVYEKVNDVKEMVDHHRDFFRNQELGANNGNGQASNMLVDGEHIDYVLHIYPSDEFQAHYLTTQPKIFSLAVSMVFLVTVISFIVYDALVEKRQRKLLENAERSGKVLASLFPAKVRERLFEGQGPQARDDERMSIRNLAKGASEMNRLRRFIAPAPHQSQSQSGDSDTATAVSGSAPAIADLYNETTVLFADIAGFTAWSSEREPTQVFQLLESLFSEFDAEAKSMKVMKIETVGDCYVAVTGLSEATPDHAAIMAKFAQRCLLRFSELTKELELSLGPGTADLGIRIGMHSGPVTAGVLRGEKARFQLFGDTMNTASRMESTSIKNMIQVTEDTATLLKKSGKGHTLIAREGLVKAKGKGYMQTYWLRPKSSHSSDSGNITERLDLLQVSQHEVDHIHSRAQQDIAREKLGLPSFSHHKLSDNVKFMHHEFAHSWNDTGYNDISKNDLGEGRNRLIQWNTAVLESILTKIVVQRYEQRKENSFTPSKDAVKYNDSALFHEEIATAVEMPSFDRESMSAACLMPSNDMINLIPQKARQELLAYVTRVASMYQSVHFHNFEHASHVTMSAQKLINKVVLRNATDLNISLHTHLGKLKTDKKDKKKRNEEADLFFSTYGISADPLAQFAVVFAALVHDVEHRGVPNVQLIKEQPDLGFKYKNKSVAENNSIRIAWSELLKPEFANLHRCIVASDDDEARFRQMLINVVIATDITDKERRAGERQRWQEAFLNNDDDFDWEKEWQNKSEEKLPDIDVSLKATVVLEQIVLASDVAHTMQHWLTYVKWNERLYKEMWAAYASGRAEKDPTEGWYKGEIGFFDGYIIPLATKLKECGVFGNAGDEYLGNALRNKAEWIEKGQAIVAEFEAKIKRKSDVTSSSSSLNREITE